ncbi:MAG: hypothetical protein HYU34_02620 [Candidatus Omnitrophica bacterium]|nr:hypothetical protein [Candidatus Omnitrophota bacterium]
MQPRRARFAVSVPRGTFAGVERRRHTLGLARSVAVDEALKLWLKKQEEEELEERYVKGYQRKPERVADIEPMFRAGLVSFTREKW